MYKIMLVDDEPFVRQGLKGLIEWEKHGFYICGEAENGRTAVDMIEELRPHIVITDVKMPEMDGLDLIRKIVCEKEWKCKFIILSGFDEFKYAQTAMKYNIRNYLLKPIEEEELISVLLELRDEISEEINAEMEDSANTQARAGETLRRLIKGEVDEGVAGFAERWLNVAGGVRMMVILLEVLNYRQWLADLEPEEIQARMDSLQSLVVQTIGRNNALNLLQEEPHRFIVLVNSAILGNFHNDDKILCQELHKTVSVKKELQVALFAGKKVNGIHLLKESYDTCLHARERSFFEKNSGVVLFDDVKDYTFNYDIRNAISYERLIQAVENGKPEQIRDALEEFFNAARRQMLAPQMVRAWLVNFILEIVKAVSEENGDTDGLLHLFRLEELAGMMMGELKTAMEELCRSAADYIKNLKEMHSPGIMVEVEKYIKRNYRSNINLKSIAEHFYINPVYLGQLFHKNYGMHFNDYLHLLRIEEAKRLLEGSELKMYEIAGKVGYSDPDYFIRKFKKLTGFSPSQYKSNI